MRTVSTIFKRELGSYFASPMGYLYIIAFVSLSVGLFITPFFVYPRASMRNFFYILPPILCVFVPAITMRLWAQERSENTYEMLLTLPLKSSSLVLGKYLASLFFYVLSLCGTLTIPFMLFILGNPDTGSLLGGYLGAFLLGALFLALGTFISGFCEDQMASFVIALVVCLGIYLLGQNFMVSFLDGWIKGFGILCKRLFSFSAHYENLIKGVLGTGDVVYFLIWISIFLFLNTLFLEGRERPNARMLFITSAGLSIVAGMIFNFLIIDMRWGRMDLTEDKIYTISPATKNILSQLKSPVTVNLYITPQNDMPPLLKDLEREITDKLEAIQAQAGRKKFLYRVIHMKVAKLLARLDEQEEKSEEKSLEERLLDKGIQPFSVQTIGEGKATSVWIYSSVGVAYKEKKEEIIPRITTRNLHQLEYQLMNIIYKMAIKKPKIVLYAPKMRIPERMRAFYMQMGIPQPLESDPYSQVEQFLRRQKYEVERIALTKNSQLPEDFDLFLILNPKNLSDRQRWEINRAIVEGKPTFLAVQNYEWDYRVEKNRGIVTKRPVQPDINTLLKNYGITISEKVLMDASSEALTISSGSLMEALFGGGITMDLPTHIVVSEESMNKENPITRRLSSIFYLWGSAVKVDEEKLKENGLTYQTLLSTSQRAWEKEVGLQLSSEDIKEPSNTERFSIMVLVEGQFPDTFSEEEVPEWEKEPTPPYQYQPEREEELEPIKPAPGKLLVTGSSQMFNDSFFQTGAHIDLLLNSIDTLSLGEELTELRSKKIVVRTMGRLKEKSIFGWKLFNYITVPVLITLLGTVRGIHRRKKRERYLGGQRG